MSFFWCKFGASLAFFGVSSHWAGCCQLLYNIYFPPHVTTRRRNGSLLLQREKTTLQSNIFFFFWFLVRSWGTQLLNIFNFPIYFKCQMTVEWSILSSLATSQVLRRSASMMGLNWLLSTFHCQPLCSSSSGLLFPL